MTASSPPPGGNPPALPIPPGYPPSAIYLGLTVAFNQGHCRTIISSGQACVLYRLSLASKDGDWIISEAPADLVQVRRVLAAHGARYRLGAPLDARWLAAGWSSHLEFQRDGLRIRTDFVSRPPRIAPARLAALWEEARTQPLPVLGIPDLIAIKRTLRDRDYAIIGALALRLSDPSEVLSNSLAPDSLLAAIQGHPDLVVRLAAQRPLLAAAAADPAAIRLLLMQERLQAMDADRRRMGAYLRAIAPWAAHWQHLAPALAEMPLDQAHERLVQEAAGRLPESVELP